MQSAESRALAGYYARVQADLLTQGLLRTDGGGPDTPFDADIVARNFERIAFFDEYERGGGLTPDFPNGPFWRAGCCRCWPGSAALPQLGSHGGAAYLDNGYD
jgi:hypothetical protein